MFSATDLTKSVVKNTMVDAAQELKDLKNNNIVSNSIPDHLAYVIDVAVSCDGTWQR